MAPRSHARLSHWYPKKSKIMDTWVQIGAYSPSGMTEISEPNKFLDRQYTLIDQFNCL